MAKNRESWITRGKNSQYKVLLY
uniref:Uncharacterized protein n=1 Tax=Tetranychus urticae TaxID=32264 RepID=T1KNY5_TETUR